MTMNQVSITTTTTFVVEIFVFFFVLTCSKLIHTTTAASYIFALAPPPPRTVATTNIISHTAFSRISKVLPPTACSSSSATWFLRSTNQYQRTSCDSSLMTSSTKRTRTTTTTISKSSTQLLSSSSNLNHDAMTTTTATTTATSSSWSEWLSQCEETLVGQALRQDAELRQLGKGAPHVHNQLRLFDSSSSLDQKLPKITLFRDHAGWCPYCEKTMLLVEEKRIPLKIELINMRSYGDKPREFLQKVPSGLLPAIEVRDDAKNNKNYIVTESQVIMELLDEWHPMSDGYKSMLPNDESNWNRYQTLARLERELFSWWCTLVFRPESRSGGNGNGGLLGGLLGNNHPRNDNSIMSPTMRAFLECIQKVEQALLQTQGPWFFDEYDHPTMIDFVYISHVERMFASLAYWKGVNLRDVPKWKLPALNRWLEAFEKKESYLAFKSDYYTNVMDIPPQYGPAFDGGFDHDRRAFAEQIRGWGDSWKLPLPFDDPLQPLYKGPPLPLCVLEAAKLHPDAQGTYEACDPKQMEQACRQMAAWKLAGNGEKIARFASRGGSSGSKNARKSFQAELADPYASPDEDVLPYVDAALRVIVDALLQVGDSVPSNDIVQQLLSAVPRERVDGVVTSLIYLRERVGVPRDLPLASARYLRAYLNWAIDELKK